MARLALFSPRAAAALETVAVKVSEGLDFLSDLPPNYPPECFPKKSGDGDGFGNGLGDDEYDDEVDVYVDDGGDGEEGLWGARRSASTLAPGDLAGRDGDGAMGAGGVTVLETLLAGSEGLFRNTDTPEEKGVPPRGWSRAEWLAAGRWHGLAHLFGPGLKHPNAQVGRKGKGFFLRGRGLELLVRVGVV